MGGITSHFNQSAGRPGERSPPGGWEIPFLESCRPHRGASNAHIRVFLLILWHATEVGTIVFPDELKKTCDNSFEFRVVNCSF